MLPRYLKHFTFSQVLPQNSSNILSVHPVSELEPLDTHFNKFRNGPLYLKQPTKLTHNVQFETLDTHFNKFRNGPLYLKQPTKLTHKNAQFYWSHAIGFQPTVSFYHCSTRIFIHVLFLLCGTNLPSLRTSKKPMLSSSRQETATSCALRYKNWKGVIWTFPGLI